VYLLVRLLLVVKMEQLMIELVVAYVFWDKQFCYDQFPYTAHLLRIPPFRNVV